MAAIVYPVTLPGPSVSATTPAERGVTSDLTGGPEQVRGLQRDYLGTQDVEWPEMDGATAAIWLAWWKDTLNYGGAWFASTWPAPEGLVSLVRRFIGAPRWVHLPGGFWRISSKMLVRGRGELPVPIIDIDVDAALNGGSSYLVGAHVTGFSPSDVLTLTLPTGKTHTGWSAWNSDSATGPGTPPPAGQYWGNGFRVTGFTPGTANWVFGSSSGYPDGPTARAAFPGGVVTGCSEYYFWIDDTNPADNRGGVSIRIAS